MGEEERRRKGGKKKKKKITTCLRASVSTSTNVYSIKIMIDFSGNAGQVSRKRGGKREKGEKKKGQRSAGSRPRWLPAIEGIVSLQTSSTPQHKGRKRKKEKRLRRRFGELIYHSPLCSMPAMRAGKVGEGGRKKKTGRIPQRVQPNAYASGEAAGRS